MRKWYRWSLVVAAAAFSVAVYNKLPESVPTHWGVHGEVNGWSSRVFAAGVAPVLMVVIAFVMPLLPNIDPRRANWEKFRPTYDLVIDAVITLLAVLHIAMLGAALGWPVSMERLVPVTVGAMFVLLGNVMPRARPNWWFGIRTPWTMTSDRVWERTHRLGGYLFVGAGVLLMLLALLPASMAGVSLAVIITASVGAAIVPLIYSYFAWKQEKPS